MDTKPQSNPLPALFAGGLLAAGGAVACLACCLGLPRKSFNTLIRLILFLCELIMSAVAILQIYVLVVTSESRNLECAVDSNVWMYCVDLIIVSFVLPVVPMLAVFISKWIMVLQPVVLGLLAAWGAYLWSVLDEKCYLDSDAKYWMIILLFKVYVVFIFLGAFASLSSTAATLFSSSQQSAGSNDSTASSSQNPYNPVPDAENGGN